MPQMPQARPQGRPQLPGGITKPGIASRPSLNGGGRPSLPGGMSRPAPSPGLRPGGPTARPGLGTLRPQPGIATKPAPGLNRPGLPGRPNDRPGLSGRPTTLPGQIGGRPGTGGLATRPTTRPSFPSPAPNRPGRPGVGGNRPTTLPGDLTQRPGIGGNRPGSGWNRPGGAVGDRQGIGGNRPGVDWNRPGISGNRPGIGGNRPGIGEGNNFWNSGNLNTGHIGNNNWANNNFNNINVGGGWGLPGHDWGYGGGAGYWNSGYVNPHYGWYNGCWGGNWGYNGGWWAPFAVGAATWGLASTLGNWGWGYGGGYANPYYSSIPAAVVAASPYDYSQPVVVNNYIDNEDSLADADTIGGATATSGSAPPAESEAVFDAALAAFKKADYAAALAGCDKAVKLSPDDSVLHEVRALALFALGRYPEAAATLNAVLAAAPGMDWTTMSGLYGSVDDYTRQLRKLEDFCRGNPDSAAGNFVLAYHYLVGGHADMAADALRVVVAKQPGDVVAKRLLDSLDPPKQDPPKQEPPGTSEPPKAEGTRGPAAAAGPETDLVGTWTATSGKDSVELSITPDSRFTWKATPAGRPAVEISGTIETARDAIALVSESSGTMTGQVASKGADAFDFTLEGAPKNAAPIAFLRRK